MASSEDASERGDTWFIDSSCSNHMSRNRILFQHLEEASNQTIRLGDEKFWKLAELVPLFFVHAMGEQAPHLALNLLIVDEADRIFRRNQD